MRRGVSLGPRLFSTNNSFFPVPPPQVEVRANQTYPLYAGDSLMLTCAVTLNPNVDSNKRVTTSWNGIDGDRYRVTTTSVMGNIYTI